MPGVIRNSVTMRLQILGRVYHKPHEGLAKAETETEHAEAAASEASELEHADDEDSEGYYGRRKRSYRDHVHATV